MQVRSRLLISVSVLDKLKDEFHVGLIGLHWDFLVDPMDAEGQRFGRRQSQLL